MFAPITPVLPSVPLRCRFTVSHTISGWALRLTQHTPAGDRQQTEYRYAMRQLATKDAIRLAYAQKCPVLQAHQADQHNALIAGLMAAYEQNKRAASLEVTPEAAARADRHLADNPDLRAELNALFGNWQNQA